LNPIFPSCRRSYFSSCRRLRGSACPPPLDRALHGFMLIPVVVAARALLLRFL